MKPFKGGLHAIKVIKLESFLKKVGISVWRTVVKNIKEILAILGDTRHVRKELWLEF